MKNLLLAVVVAVLLVMAVVQAVQLNSLKDKLEGGVALKASSTSSAPSSSSSSGNVPTSLQNLPQMVGGC